MSRKAQTESEKYIVIRNQMHSPAKTVENFRLILDSDFVLVLENIFYVPTFTRNLIFISRLDKVGFSITFVSSGFNLCKDSTIVGSDLLVDDFYIFSLDHQYEQSFILQYSSL